MGRDEVVSPVPLVVGEYMTEFGRMSGKPSKRSMGRVIVCCKCRCAGVQLMRYGNGYICVECIRKGKA